MCLCEALCNRMAEPESSLFHFTTRLFPCESRNLNGRQAVAVILQSQLTFVREVMCEWRGNRKRVRPISHRMSLILIWMHPLMGFRTKEEK